MTTITKLLFLSFSALTLLLGCGSVQIMNTAQQASVYQFTIIMQGNQYTAQQKEWMTRQACYDLGYQWSLGQSSYPAINNPEFNNIRKIEVAATQGLVNLNRVNCLHNAIQRYRMNEDQRFNSTVPGNTTLPPQVPEQDIRKLMSLGADLNYLGNLGKRRTPLFYAAGTTVQYGADQNFTYYRSQSTQLYVMLVLLGARDDIVDADGFTPKHIFMEVYYPKQIQQAYMYTSPGTPHAQYPQQNISQPIPQSTAPTTQTTQTTTQINQQQIDRQYALIMVQAGKNKTTPPNRIINNLPVQQSQNQTPIKNQPISTADEATATQQVVQPEVAQVIQKNKQPKIKKEKTAKQQQGKNKKDKADKNKSKMKNDKKKKRKNLDVIPNTTIASTGAAAAASSSKTASSTVPIVSTSSVTPSQTQTPVIAQTKQQEDSASSACYKIETGQFYQSANPKEAPIGSSQPDYSVAAYKPLYCVNESEDSNHRDKNKNVVKQYLQIRKLSGNNPECSRGERQGIFNSKNAAVNASSKTFPQLKQHHCDSYNRW